MEYIFYDIYYFLFFRNKIKLINKDINIKYYKLKLIKNYYAILKEILDIFNQ